VASDAAFAQFLMQSSADPNVTVKMARWELLAALLHVRLQQQVPDFQCDPTALGLQAAEESGDFQAITAILVLRYMLQVPTVFAANVISARSSHFSRS
jgi:hypothetical protein